MPKYYPFKAIKFVIPKGSFYTGRVQHERYNFFPRVELFSYLIDVLNHFLRLLRRTSCDRNVYWPPLKEFVVFLFKWSDSVHTITQMLKYVNTKKINTNFSFTFAISRRGQNSQQRNFLLRQDFFPNCQKCVQWVFARLGKKFYLDVCILNPPLFLRKLSLVLKLACYLWQ